MSSPQDWGPLSTAKAQGGSRMAPASLCRKIFRSHHVTLALATALLSPTATFLFYSGSSSTTYFCTSVLTPSPAFLLNFPTLFSNLSTDHSNASIQLSAFARFTLPLCNHTCPLYVSLCAPQCRKMQLGVRHGGIHLVGRVDFRGRRCTAKKLAPSTSYPGTTTANAHTSLSTFATPATSPPIATTLCATLAASPATCASAPRLHTIPPRSAFEAVVCRVHVSVSVCSGNGRTLLDKRITSATGRARRGRKDE